MARSIPLIVLLGCAPAGQGVSISANAPAALFAASDRVRIAIYDGRNFSCDLAHGPRPDPVVPRVVLPMSAMGAQLTEIPERDSYVIILDLLAADGAEVGFGCAAGVSVQTNAVTAVAIDVAPYPSVVAMIPNDGAERVSPTITPKVVFSAAMASESIDSASLRVLSLPDRTEVFARRVGPEEGDESGRTFIVEVPFALARGGRYALEAGGAGTALSDDALPLRAAWTSEFTVADSVDLERDISGAAIRKALGDGCSCASIANAERLIRDLAPTGNEVLVSNWPHVITEVSVTRAAPSERTMRCRADDVPASCTRTNRAIGTVFYERPEPTSPERCRVVVEIEVTVRDCYCAGGTCPGGIPAPDVVCDALECTDG